MRASTEFRHVCQIATCCEHCRNDCVTDCIVWYVAVLSVDSCDIYVCVTYLCVRTVYNICGESWRCHSAVLLHSQLQIVSHHHRLPLGKKLRIVPSVPAQTAFSLLSIPIVIFEKYFLSKNKRKYKIKSQKLFTQTQNFS